MRCPVYPPGPCHRWSFAGRPGHSGSPQMIIKDLVSVLGVVKTSRDYPGATHSDY